MKKTLAREVISLFEALRLDEASTSVDILKYLKGLKSSGLGIGILTSDNPMGKKASSRINNANMKILKAMLKSIISEKSMTVDRERIGPRTTKQTKRMR